MICKNSKKKPSVSLVKKKKKQDKKGEKTKGNIIAKDF